MAAPPCRSQPARAGVVEFCIVIGCYSNRPCMFRAFTLVAVIGSGVVSSAVAADWILAPSTYTHDPQTGRRVTQYAPIEPVVVPTRPDYIKSGYRHNRSSIYSGNGADHHHVVEQWGRPVRPYGEWLYP